MELNKQQAEALNLHDANIAAFRRQIPTLERLGDTGTPLGPGDKTLVRMMAKFVHRAALLRMAQESIAAGRG